MSPDDVFKTKKIQAILVRNYVDTSKIEIDVHQTTAYLTGELHIAEFDRRSKDATEQRMAVKKSCLAIEQEIRRGGDIFDIQWKLRNWERIGNQWHQKKG